MNTSLIEDVMREPVTTLIAGTIQETLLATGPEIRPHVMAAIIVRVLRKADYDV